MARAAALGALAMLPACTRVVSVDAPEGPAHLVVEGRIERVVGNVTGVQTIHLTLTSAYFDTSTAPPATGALVRVSDDSGTGPVIFSESAPGVYTTAALVGVVGRTYTLTIDYYGEHYQATDSLAAVAPIDSLYFAAAERSENASSTGVRATIAFHDPPGADWYLWEELINGVRVLGPDSTQFEPVTSSDAAFDGRAVTGFQPFGGIAVPLGALVLVRQLGISASAYQYFNALAQQTTASGSPFAIPPSSVRGNVSNLTDPTQFALGYFMAAEVSDARRTYLP